METDLPGLSVDNLPLLGVVLTMWLVLILGSGWLVLKGAKYPPPLAIVLVLAVVTLVCIAGFVVTRDQTILQLASMGLGALAAAVAATWTHSSTKRKEDEQAWEEEKKREEEHPPEEKEEEE